MTIFLFADEITFEQVDKIFNNNNNNNMKVVLM